MSGPDLVRDGASPRWPLEREPMLLETSLPGVFVAGDVRRSSMKRVASAVGEGAMAVLPGPPVPGDPVTLARELGATFLFESLSEEQLERLAALGVEVPFETGDIIFVEGQPAEFLWVLLVGRDGAGAERRRSANSPRDRRPPGDVRRRHSGVLRLVGGQRLPSHGQSAANRAASSDCLRANSAACWPSGRRLPSTSWTAICSAWRASKRRFASASA